MTTCRLSVSRGNSKTGKIQSISFPTRGCPSQCAYCYARNIERRYPAVARAWAGNAWYFRETPEAEIVECIRHEIAGAGLFRWLVGGEFTDKAFSIAVELAERMSRTRFMAYTKRSELGKIRRPPNFMLLFSYPEVYDSPYSEVCATPEVLDDLVHKAHAMGFDSAAVIFREYTNCPHQVDGRTCQQCQGCYYGEPLAIRLHR